jgi:hypothetical protein
MGRTEGKLGHYPSPGGGTALAGYNRGCCAQGTGERQTSCLDHKQLMGLRGSCQDRLWRKKKRGSRESSGAYILRGEKSAP